MRTTVFYTAKPGQGCTVTAARYALEASRHHPVLIIGNDDLAAAYGIPSYSSGAVREDDLGIQLWADDGQHRPPPGFSPSELVIDAGPYPGATADRRILVTTGCYMALRRATCAPPFTPDLAVLIEQPGRALTLSDVERVVNVPVVPVPSTPQVALTVDAGILSRREPDRDAITRLYDEVNR